MMKRIFSLLLVLMCICTLFAACSAKYEDVVFDEAFMIDKARKLAADVCTMAKDDAISALYNVPPEARGFVEDIGSCKAGKADEVYLISGAPSLKRVLRYLAGTDDSDGLDAKTQELMEKRFNWAVSLPSYVNVRFGTSVIAAASYMTIGESYRVEAVGEESYLVVLYNRGNFAIAVSFVSSGEGIVHANAVPILYDGVEYLEEIADDLRIDFEELDLSDSE
jgi:hypothetical protein